MGTTDHGMDLLALRRRSVTRLARWTLADPGTLPLHHDEDCGWMRDADAVTGRCHPAAAVLARVDEQALQQLIVAWREEALLALLWTLRLVDELAPDKMCPKEPVYEKLAPGLDLARARTDLRLRPLDAIAAMLDLYYCLHWQARGAQYHGEIWDYQLAPGVVLERRRALEWLFQDVPWEEVDLGA